MLHELRRQGPCQSIVRCSFYGGFHSRRCASGRSSTIAWPGVALIALDHTRQEIEKEPAFSDGERGQESFLSSQSGGLELLTQLFARAGSAQQSCPAIIRMHATLEHAHRFEPVDHFANTCGIDAKPLGQPALVEARQVNDCGKDGVFTRDQAGRDDDLRDGTLADLVKAPGQMRRNAMRWCDWVPGATARQADCHLDHLQAVRPLTKYVILRIQMI
jgi:hypothetical protein